MAPLWPGNEFKDR